MINGRSNQKPEKSRSWKTMPLVIPVMVLVKLIIIIVMLLVILLRLVVAPRLVMSTYTASHR